MTSYLSEGTDSLDYTTTYHHLSPPNSYSHKSTIDLIGEEFIKKEGSAASIINVAVPGFTDVSSASMSRAGSASLPSLTYTTTTIPTISTGEQQQNHQVQYCNLDEMSRYNLDSLDFDMAADSSTVTTTTYNVVGGNGNVGSPQMLEADEGNAGRSMTISIPGDRGSAGQSFTVQLKSANQGMLTIPTIDTTKLTGQLSVVQELPEVSRLVFQEVKQDTADSIVNILETMKEDHDPASLSPLDYTVHSPEETPLNLVTPSNGGNRGLKRVMVSASSIASAVNSSIISSTSGGRYVNAVNAASLHDTLSNSNLVDSFSSDPKRLKNIVVLQQDGSDDQLLHHLATMNSGPGYTTTLRTSSSPVGSMDMDGCSTMNQLSYLDSSTTPSSPVSPGLDTSMSSSGNKKSPGGQFSKAYSTKTVAGTVIPSSKTCNWVFENGQVCGKTFSKSYNLVVHMRMHEDIRPFACTLCDQTFRQKAHLQRHETTHGIHTKSFYRNPPAKGSGRRRKRGGGGGRMGRLDSTAAVANMKKEDSEGEMMEDEEDDMYVPNGNPAAKRVCPLKAAGRSYPSPDCEDREMDSDTGLYEGNRDIINGSGDGVTSTTPTTTSTARLVSGGCGSSVVNEPMHEGSLNHELHQESFNDLSNDKFKFHQVVPGSSSSMDAQPGSNLIPVSAGGGGTINMIHQDDDTSTVQDILHTVNSVPTLEQNIRYLQQNSYSNSNQLRTTQAPAGRGRVHQISKLVDTTTISNLSLSNNNLPGLSATLSQHLPGASNILYTTLSPQAASNGSSKVVIENLDEHSPEIQAELLNALLADESYQGGGAGDYEEEVYRLNTLPSTWWVSRKTRQNGLISEVTYYSPQGLSFRSKDEIQNFMQNNIINRETRTAGLRNPPIAPEYLPILDDAILQPTSVKISTAICSQPGSYLHPTITTSSTGGSLDANTIAQALIANLKPEPLESLQSVMAEAKPLQDISISSPAIPHTLAASN